jgi:hypothetical protein
MQLTKVGGKFGRYTFFTICMSNGGDSLATKAATGHKSTDSLAGKYHNELFLCYSCSNFYILIFSVC